MHDRRPLHPPNGDEEWPYPPQPSDAFATHQSHDPEPPRYRPDTGELIYACPACESFRTEPRHLARRIGGALGAAAGGTSAAAASLSGAEIGAAAGSLGGPFGVLCGSIAGAIIACLAGAAAGCATGAALGETLDQKVLLNWCCRACGHTFSNRPD
ncbi:hypothetical protein [Ralstonia insidiosa]|uniref:hypothetical protein n=1 Tax=Ralstonia insidiosa TaxID=190721 RepID=UPI001FC95059|nr:hypothetical protein [Ralstonia insidiosa]